jgi:tryptophan synthase beta chain
MATKVILPEAELPTHWYNIVPDLPTAAASRSLHPGTHQPVGPDDLAPLFPMDLILQEVSEERYVEIPEEVREVYRLWRPSPLYRAHGLERLIGGPARIYYKYEGVSPVGSHKPNTAVAQAYYNAKAGIRKLSTETGAGQWGSALAFACAMFGLDCEVFMVRASYDQKPYRKSMIEAYGATIHPSPSTNTNYGRAVLEADPDTPGSLGIAISEAVEVAATNPDTNYSLGSVLNHVLMHQTVIGEEALKQMAMVGEKPDVVIGCAGGGSNFAGLAFPFVREKLAGNMDPVIRAVEPAAAPSLTRGEYRYDFGDTGMMTPLVKMYTLGHDFVPDPIHAGGLRYHGMAPLVSHLLTQGTSRPRRCIRPRPSGEQCSSPRRRNHSWSRADACGGFGDDRSGEGEGDRGGEGDSLQPVRARPLRHGGLPGLHHGQPGRLRAPVRSDRRVAGEGTGGRRGLSEGSVLPSSHPVSPG